MPHIAPVLQDTLTVDVAHIPAVYAPAITQVVVRSEFGKVVLFVGTRRVELTTTQAHGIGLTIARATPQLEPGEMIVIAINGEKLELLKPMAQRVAGALLRKADDADDWQIANGSKRP